MNHKNTILRVLLAAILFIAPATAEDAKRPNIIVILVDDMGYSDLGCYGSEIETPNIDALASNGVRFTQFYNCGRCCPTRASLMTGLHPHQAGIGHMTEPPGQPLGFEGPYQGFLNDNCTTLAEVMKSAGYQTFMTGKWHLGYHNQKCWPLQRGFDKYYGCIAGANNYFHPNGDRGIKDGNDPIEVGEGWYATDAFTQKACQFITESQEEKADAPFFLYLAYNAPHWPLNAKWLDYQKYKGRYSAGWEALMKTRLAKQQAMGMFSNDLVPAPHVGPKWNTLSEQKQTDLDAIMAAYAGCIDAIDRNVGELVRKLNHLGELDNTVIFLMSDNGACQEGGTLGQGNEEMIRNPPPGTAGVRQGLAWANASNTPFRLYKHFIHEGGACTPMIAHWPNGISQELRGKFVRQFAYLPDVMPTCMELAGAEYPTGIPMHVGKSILPALEGSEQAIHEEPIYWEHEGNAGMRWGKWKLVREYKKDWELFNLEEDRAEMNNLATSNGDKRKEMVGMWEAWGTQHRVAFPKAFNMYQFLNARKRKAKETAKSK